MKKLSSRIKLLVLAIVIYFMLPISMTKAAAACPCWAIYINSYLVCMEVKPDWPDKVDRCYDLAYLNASRAGCWD